MEIIQTKLTREEITQLYDDYSKGAIHYEAFSIFGKRDKRIREFLKSLKSNKNWSITDLSK